MRVVVADDAMLTREGLARLLQDAGVEVVAEAAGRRRAAAHGRARHAPTSAIVDIRMPPTHTDEGLVAAQAIRSQHPDVGGARPLQLHRARATRCSCSRTIPSASATCSRSASSTSRSSSTRCAGSPTASPWSTRRSSRACSAAGASASALDELTAREREVLALLAEGLSNHAIAQRLVVTDRTVEAHVKQIFQKLDLAASPDSHRRVLAVLTYLRAA